MAQFKFHLEAVLKHRKHLEREKQRAVAVIQHEFSQLEQILRKLDDEMRNANDDMRNNRLIGSLDLKFLAAHRRFANDCHRRGLEIAQKMAETKLRLEAAQRDLSAAAVQRKIIEKLREKQEQRWKQEQDRKELMQQDEIAMQLAFENVVSDIELNEEGAS